MTSSGPSATCPNIPARCSSARRWRPSWPSPGTGTVCPRILRRPGAARPVGVGSAGGAQPARPERRRTTARRTGRHPGGGSAGHPPRRAHARPRLHPEAQPGRSALGAEAGGPGHRDGHPRRRAGSRLRRPGGSAGRGPGRGGRAGARGHDRFAGVLVADQQAVPRPPSSWSWTTCCARWRWTKRRTSEKDR